MSTLEEKIQSIEHALGVLKTQKAVAEARMALGENLKLMIEKIDEGICKGDEVLKELKTRKAFACGT